MTGASWRWLVGVSVFGLIAVGLAAQVVAQTSPGESTAGQLGSQADRPAYSTCTVRGRVRFVGDVLKRRFGVSVVPEAADRLLVVETSDGQLVPLVEDVRGRAFRRDQRLRDMDLELLVRKYEGSPLVQVIQVFSIEPDGKYELDYWCDICAIAMFELKPCDCCQGDVRLRKRKVSERDK